MAEQPRVPDRFRLPPRQDNLQRAVQKAFDSLAGQTDEQFGWLGAQRVADFWRLPVLSDAFDVSVAARRVSVSTGAKVGLAWQILALHYLDIRSRPEMGPPQITFADLATARSYAEVYRQRTVGRLCATVGRTAEGLRAGAIALEGRPAPGGDAAFDFDVFPRVRLRLIWHAADEEFPPSATILLPANIEACFCAEDIVVLSECLVSRLCARPY